MVGEIVKYVFRNPPMNFISQTSLVVDVNVILMVKVGVNVNYKIHIFN